MKAKRTNTVKHKVTESITYNVYAFANGQTELVETITCEKRPSETELCKKHGCPKVILEEVAKVQATYEMPLDEFMAYATKIEDEITE